MKPIICRVNPRMWWWVLLASGEALFMLASPIIVAHEAPRPVLWWGIAFLWCLAWGMGGLIGWAALTLGADLWRGEICADEDGLRWRREFAREKSAHWDEISDFYLSAHSKGRRTGGGRPTVATAQGELELAGNFDGVEAIIALVPQRALNADAEIWRMREADLGAEWEQTVRMWTPEQKWAAPLFSLFLLAFGVGVPAGFVLGARSSKPPLGNFWFDALPFGLGVLACAGVGALFVCATVVIWRERNFAWRHRAQTLSLDARGVVFRDETERIEARWNEVGRVEPLEKTSNMRRARVTTARGEFVLVGPLWGEFRARCQNYAPAALEPTPPEAQEPESLEFELNPTPPGADGARTFSFATVGNRLLALIFSLVSSVAPLLYLLIGYSSSLSEDEPFAPSWPLVALLCALAVTVSGALWLWFARAFIVAAPDELRLHWPLCAPRTLAWANIEAHGADVWGDWVRVEGRKVYWARGLFPARRGELRALVADKMVAQGET